MYNRKVSYFKSCPCSYLSVMSHALFIVRKRIKTSSILMYCSSCGFGLDAAGVGIVGLMFGSVNS